MAETKRTEFQIKMDRKLIRKLLMRGIYTHQQITDKINDRYSDNRIPIVLTRQQISYDIAEMLKDLEQSEIKDTKQFRAFMAMRLFKKADRADEAYEKSTKEKIKEIEKTGSNARGGFNEDQTITEYPVGDPRFLKISVECDREVNKLYNLYTGLPTKPTTEDPEEEEEIESAVLELPDNGRD